MSAMQSVRGAQTSRAVSARQAGPRPNARRAISVVPNAVKEVRAHASVRLPPHYLARRLFDRCAALLTQLLALIDECRCSCQVGVRTAADWAEGLGDGHMVAPAANAMCAHLLAQRCPPP